MIKSLLITSTDRLKYSTVSSSRQVVKFYLWPFLFPRSQYGSTKKCGWHSNNNGAIMGRICNTLAIHYVWRYDRAVGDVIGEYVKHNTVQSLYNTIF